MHNGITVSLENHKLWEKFHTHGNEMIITKVGRRMFPKLEYRIRGLDPNGTYQAILYLERADEYRWKYNGKTKWEKSGTGEQIEIPQPICLNEPNMVSSGRQLMERSVMFDSFKMTNNIMQRDKSPVLLVYVQSMHRYIPLLKIFQIPGPNELPILVHEFRTSLTEFFAVTCYQNPDITHEKIAFNPFAKGFRETNGRKRSRTPPLDETNSNLIRRTPTDQPGLHAEEKKCSPTIVDLQMVESWPSHPYPMGVPPSQSTSPSPPYLNHLQSQSFWSSPAPWTPTPYQYHHFYPSFNISPMWPPLRGTGEGIVPQPLRSNEELCYPNPFQSITSPIQVLDLDQPLLNSNSDLTTLH